MLTIKSLCQKAVQTVLLIYELFLEALIAVLVVIVMALLRVSVPGKVSDIYDPDRYEDSFDPDSWDDGGLRNDPPRVSRK